jgi:hypothetical protein
VPFQSIPQPTKSTSEKPIRSSEEEAEYQISNSGMCLRYLSIHWTAIWCEERGEDWKRAHNPTLNWMSGRVIVRSTASPSSSRPSDVVELIRVDMGLSSTMLNFFIRSFVYFAWCTKVPCFIYFTWIPKKRLVLPSCTSGTHSPSFPEIWTQEYEKSNQR